jgi:valyl-tRNA synthetase
MIMAGNEYMDKKPFSEVYFTGIVRDKQGRKMSKSLGNSPDLLELIDRYGADAVRFGIMISSPAGNDLLWDEASNEQGSFFINKIWNALKLVKIWEGKQAAVGGGQFAVEWFDNRLNEARIELDGQFKEFRLSEALKTLYSLIWDDFCSWYLEWVKPNPNEAIDRVVYEKTVDFLEQLMHLLHPFMPFITEEVYHQLRERKDDLMVRQYKTAGPKDEAVLTEGKLLKLAITSIRDARNKNQLKPRDPVRIHIQSANADEYRKIEGILSKQVNAESIAYTNQGITNAITVVVEKDKFFIESNVEIDRGAQQAQLEKDLDYLKGFLASVDKKLENERFVQNAKAEVIEAERKKKKDAEEKIRVIEESLASLRN